MLAMQEPVSVLKGTLTGLAEHPGARERYLVVLAMEAGEKGHADKALKLIAEFAGRCAPAPVRSCVGRTPVAGMQGIWAGCRNVPSPGSLAMQACAFVSWLLEKLTAGVQAELRPCKQVPAHDVVQPPAAGGRDAGQGVQRGLGGALRLQPLPGGWCVGPTCGGLPAPLVALRACRLHAA